MASLALEEKINKIRLRNEEIKRRYEEVEADKKNAAKLDALAKPIPQEDWPTRKEPPEFSGPVVKQNSKPKQSVRKPNDQPTQHYAGNVEGKKNHTFADGQGPPPDPKYNFLADSEREEPGNEFPKDSEKNRGRNKTPRGGFKRRGSGRDWHTKEHWNQHEASGNTSHPDYEAWRAERNRIDEARISRQRTAEGNWRREWDNDKFHLADETTKRENRVSLGDVVSRQEYNENDKFYRSPRTTPRFSHQSNPRESHQVSSFPESTKSHNVGPESEKRVVIATEKSMKIQLNSEGTASSRSSVMSVKVSSPNIAGTGRVGPRQRPRVMYSSQSEPVDSSNLNESSPIARQRSIEENTRVRNFETHKVSSPKSPHYQRKSDGKNQYFGKKDDFEDTPKPLRKDSQKSPHARKQINLVNSSIQFLRDHRKSDRQNDSTKSVQDQKTNDTENNFSNEAAKQSHDEEPKLLDGIENTREQNENPEFQVEPVAEFREICEDNEIATGGNQEENFLSRSTNGNCEPSLENVAPENSIIHQHEMSMDINGDAAECNDSVDDIESSEAINCSVNSGVISNDSGFIELPSNDSFHDISDNATIEINKVDEESPRSLPSTSEVSEIVEVKETESTSAINPSPNDTQSEIPCDIANSCGNEENNSESANKIELESQENESSSFEKSGTIPQDVETLENS